MTAVHPRHQLVDALTHPVRFSLVAALNATDNMDFASLRDQLQVSDSVLSRQASALEVAFFVRNSNMGRDEMEAQGYLRPGSANVVHRHKRITCGVAEHFQLVGFGGVVIQDGIENQFAAVAGEIFINGKRLPRFAVSMPKVHH